ncbi:MAG: T9SS type A sorting domain-containing protein [Taibaiella sp.]
MKKTFTFLFALCITISRLQAQTAFWTDNFETGSPTGIGGARTPEVSGGIGTPYTSYFVLATGSNISQVVPFTGLQGSNYWAGEDHNVAGTGWAAAGTGANDTLNELSITWTGIDISGKTNLSFKGLFAANSTSQPWDNMNACLSGVATTNTDYIILQYRIDGGSYTNLIRFYNRGSATNGTDKYLYEDTNNNGCGDSAQLTNAFSEFTKNITGTGSLLDLQLLVYSEGTNEEWGVDNFRIFGSVPLPIAISRFEGKSVPAGNLLTWSGTTSYTNFEIERSKDGVIFEHAGTVSANPQNQYSFLDENPFENRTFYRLVVPEDHGNNLYSAVISVFRQSIREMTFAPNPMSSSTQINNIPETLFNTEIVLTDASGSVLKRATIHGRELIVNMEELKPGLYLLYFRDGQVVKLVKHL